MVPMPKRGNRVKKKWDPPLRSSIFEEMYDDPGPSTSSAINFPLLHRVARDSNSSHFRYSEMFPPEETGKKMWRKKPHCGQVQQFSLRNWKVLRAMQEREDDELLKFLAKLTADLQARFKKADFHESTLKRMEEILLEKEEWINERAKPLGSKSMNCLDILKLEMDIKKAEERLEERENELQERETLLEEKLALSNDIDRREKLVRQMDKKLRLKEHILKEQEEMLEKTAENVRQIMSQEQRLIELQKSLEEKEKLLKEQEQALEEEKTRFVEVKKTMVEVKNESCQMPEVLTASAEMFVAAAVDGEINTLKSFINTGINPDIASEGGMTALLHATMRGDVEMIRYLVLEAKANLSAKDYLGRTALHWAVTKNHIKVVESLIQLKGIDLEARNCNGKTALHTAAQNGQLDLVECLVTAGAEFAVYDSLFDTPLICAARNGHEDIVKFILDEDPHIERKNVAMLSAACNGHARIVKRLLDTGAALVACNTSGDTALHLAAREGHKEVTAVLLKYESENLVHARNCWVLQGRTALHEAALKGHSEIIHLLLENGAEVNCQDCKGETALHLATQGCHIVCVQLLVDGGANVNVTSKWFQRTPLHNAAIAGNVFITRILLDAGALVDAKTTHHITPLICATSNNRLNIVKMLVEAGCNINDNSNPVKKTALHYAAKKGGPDVINYLIDNGAPVDSYDIRGMTPLLIAAENNNVEAVKQLISFGADINAIDNSGRNLLTVTTSEDIKNMWNELQEKK